ncbi:DUF4168 domain-containing protein [Sphingomonas sp. AR_OL41]|uniref:DUF4168 domain-containing protein n=1 Tax=Sphingomonas sp. AR_OL41 TaxID=3042729 RepID=UPI0024810143|nr:DUF4168 domain-containing protein [Sphingomonas sp. AR_OL41]MDH7974198.1 DUF4168 domain-containing protein [Sphingomonas sp. AR_OL41]
MKNIALIALLLAAPAAMGATQTRSGVPSTTFTGGQLHDYARALAEIQRVRSTLAARTGKLAPADQKLLAEQANAAVILILQHNRLDPATFNAISKAVEDRPDIRLEVKQAMMADAIGFGST